MVKVTYNPTDPGDTITEAFGRIFEAGQSADITDDKTLAKLKGNPEFDVGGAKAADDSEGKARARESEKLAKVVDGRSKEAREARQKAAEADQAAAAKERAAEQARAIADARQEAEDEKAG